MLTVPNPQLEDELLYDLASPDEPAPRSLAPAITPDPGTARVSATAATVPPIAPFPQPKAYAAATRPATTALADEAESAGGVRRYLYLLLMLTFLPLAWMTFAPEDDIEARFDQTMEHNPEIALKIFQVMQSETADDDDFFALLPDQRIEGALLARNSVVHWFFALIAGGAFFGGAMVIFPAYHSNARQLAGVALFTGTMGIFFLLAVQWIAALTDGWYVTGRGLLVLLFYIAKFIAFSYSAALDSDTNFFLSMFGFTFGVGMCEELCKALPLLYHYRAGKSDLPWKGACLWGLISGVGFGVSEGITYSGDMYNGLLGGDIYLVRFVSCVALHAVWAAAAGITIYKYQNLLQGAESVWGVMGQSIVLVLVPMVLHGLYDTLLKKDYGGLALVAALISFAWLAWQIETARRKFGENDPGGAVAYA